MFSNNQRPLWFHAFASRSKASRVPSYVPDAQLTRISRSRLPIDLMRGGPGPRFSATGHQTECAAYASRRSIYVRVAVSSCHEYWASARPQVAQQARLASRLIIDCWTAFKLVFYDIHVRECYGKSNGLRIYVQQP